MPLAHAVAVLAAAAIAGSPDGTAPPEADFGRLARLEFAAATAPDRPPGARGPDGSLKPRFGQKNSWRWNVQAGFAFSVQDASDTFVLAGGSASYFMIDNLSLVLELNGLYINQTGDDPLGLNFGLLARWHFLARPAYTVYAELGAGLLFTTSNVPGPTPSDPKAGQSVNFTPQLGAGFTYEINPNVRLMGGIRWFHMSNARTSDSNPPRDSILTYVGVSFPF